MNGLVLSGSLLLKSLFGALMDRHRQPQCTYLEQVFTRFQLYRRGPLGV